MRSEKSLLSEGACSEDSPQHSRGSSRSGARDQQDRGVLTIAARAEEGGNAVRSSQTHSAPRPIAPARPKWSERRVPTCRHSPKPKEVGEVDAACGAHPSVLRSETSLKPHLGTGHHDW